MKGARQEQPEKREVLNAPTSQMKDFPQFRGVSVPLLCLCWVVGELKQSSGSKEQKRAPTLL